MLYLSLYLTISHITTKRIALATHTFIVHTSQVNDNFERNTLVNLRGTSVLWKNIKLVRYFDKNLKLAEVHSFDCQ
jgi:hypothetical protein